MQISVHCIIRIWYCLSALSHACCGFHVDHLAVGHCCNKQAQGKTERLKEENALEWTGRLNTIRACAREIVNEEIIQM